MKNVALKPAVSETWEVQQHVCQCLTFHNRVPVHPCDKAYLLCYDVTLLRTFRNITDPQIRRNQRYSGNVNAAAITQTPKLAKKRRKKWMTDRRTDAHTHASASL